MDAARQWTLDHRERTWVETCLEHSNQEAHHEHRGVILQESKRQRQHPPAEEQDAEPQRWAEEVLEHEIGRDIKDAVGDGEGGHGHGIVVGTHVE